MTALPASLARWEESLAVLDARLAVALGPLLHILDDLVGRLDSAGGETGEPDGYDGTTHRGDLGRLLMDEWLLADEIPMEFLRRAAENELTFLRRAHRREAPRGRVIAVVDTGPEQLGVGRLVQLAALVVLHRRAAAQGAGLVLRLLADPESREGELADLLQHWLRGRVAVPPTRAQVEDALGCGEGEDHIWLLGGPTARASAPSHRRTVSARPTAWGDAGATEVTIGVAGSTVRLPVPGPRVAIAALRGEGLFRQRTRPTTGAVPTTGRGAVFGSADARLLWRGAEPGELYGCFVGAKDASRVKRYRVNGTVVAAASLGRRVVAAVTDGTGLWVHVVGKKLARADRIHVPLTGLGIGREDLERIQSAPLRPLYLRGGSIVIGGADGWYSLDDGEITRLHQIAALAPGHALDSPREAYIYPGGLLVAGSRVSVTAIAAGPIFGPAGGWSAWSEDTRVWKVARGPDVLTEIAVDEGDRVLGLCVAAGAPALIVVSPSGRIVRQVSPSKVKTWTRFAGPAHFSVHPIRPWLARTTDSGITVGDLSTGETLLEIRAEP